MTKKEIIETFSQKRNDYVFCGMIRLLKQPGLFYIGSDGTINDFEKEFELTINKLSDFLLVSEWPPDDYADAINGELENRNYHNQKITPHDILNALPTYVSDRGKSKVLEDLYAWLIPDQK